MLPESFLFHQFKLIWKRGISSGSIVCMGKIATSVLLKLFINDYERCLTTDIDFNWRVPSQNGSYWKANYIHIVFTFVSFLLQICVWSANPSQYCHSSLWLLFICTLNKCVLIYVATFNICLGGLDALHCSARGPGFDSRLWHLFKKLCNFVCFLLCFYFYWYQKYISHVFLNSFCIISSINILTILQNMWSNIRLYCKICDRI